MFKEKNANVEFDEIEKSYKRQGIQVQKTLANEAPHSVFHKLSQSKQEDILDRKNKKSRLVRLIV
jgi:hypothetical protein